MSSLVTEELKPCGKQGPNIVSVRPTKGKRNKDGDFAISTEVMSKISLDEHMSVDLEAMLNVGKKKMPSIKIKIKNCEELMTTGQGIVAKFMKIADSEYTGCPIPAGNYSVKDWVSKLRVPIIGQGTMKMNTKIKISSKETEVGCFKAISKLKREKSTQFI